MAGQPTPASGPPPASTPPAGRRRRTLLHHIRASPPGRLLLKVGVAVAGGLVVALGVALIPLPGPGWLLILSGLGIWAIEFHWARRLRGYTRRHLDGWWRWITRRPWPVRATAGTAGTIVAGALLVLSLRYSLGVDLVGQVRGYLPPAWPQP